MIYSYHILRRSHSEAEIIVMLQWLIAASVTSLGPRIPQRRAQGSRPCENRSVPIALHLFAPAKRVTSFTVFTRDERAGCRSRATLDSLCNKPYK